MQHLSRWLDSPLELARQLAIRLSHKFPGQLNILSARPSPAVQAININNHSIKQAQAIRKERERERRKVLASCSWPEYAEALRVLITVALSITNCELNAHSSVCEIINWCNQLPHTHIHIHTNTHSQLSVSLASTRLRFRFFPSYTKRGHNEAFSTWLKTAKLHGLWRVVKNNYT